MPTYQATAVVTTTTSLPGFGRAPPPHERGADGVSGERGDVEHGRDRHHERGHRDDVAGDEPREPPREMGVPVEQGPHRRRVDRRGVDDAPGPRRLAGASAVERDPPVLLAHEVEDRDVGERTPERELAQREETDARREPQDGHGGEQPRTRSPLRRIEIRAEHGRPDVRDVAENDGRDPCPARRLVMERAGEGAERRAPRTRTRRFRGRPRDRRSARRATRPFEMPCELRAPRSPRLRRNVKRVRPRSSKSTEALWWSPPKRDAEVREPRFQGRADMFRMMFCEPVESRFPPRFENVATIKS